VAVAAYIAVGSNIHPETNIPAALDKLMRFVRVTASSTFYRTAPLSAPGTPAGKGARATGGNVGATSRGDPEFLNGVWRIETGLDARALKFTVLRRIEEELGRTRGTNRYAPRTIDLDLLIYGSMAINEPDLRVPDPDIRSRPFLAVPLLQLAPDLVLADNGERLADVCHGGPRPCAGEALMPDREITEQLNERIKP